MSDPWEVKATTGGTGDFDCPKGGAYPAVLVALVDLGTHPEEFVDKATGKKKYKDMRKVQMVWELTSEPSSKPGVNHVVGRDFSMTFSEKSNLRKFAETWRGQRYKDGETLNISKLVGQKCMLTITEVKSGEKTFAKVENVSPVPRGMEVQSPKLTPKAYGITDELPAWIPYIYGEKAVDMRSMSREIKGSAPAQTPTAAAPTQQAPATQKTDEFVPGTNASDLPF